ncbi:MAG: OmpA family protein [Anaeromyxobacteraceae bacterium]
MLTFPHLRGVLVTCAAIALSACGGQPSGGSGATQLAEAPLFVNGGFEDGTTTGWTITTHLTPAGQYTSAGITYPPASLGDLNLRSGGSARTYVRTAPAQQLYGLSGLAQPVLPKFGNASVVVNEGGKNYNVNTLKQSYAVTTSDVDPADGKVHVRFALAPALQDPGHPVNQQPYFWAQLRNVTRNTLLFTTFNYSNQPGIPWNVQGTGQNQVRYTDWQIFDVAPGDAKLTPGDTVEIAVVAAGCAQTGHWGEVAVDGFGAYLPSLSVAASAPQAANAGTQLTYTFLVKNATPGLVPNVVVDEVLPAAFSGATQTGQTTFVSVSAPAGATCTTPAVGQAGTVSCNFGWMNPSASATFSVTVAIPNGATGRIANGNYAIRADSVSALLGPLVETALTSAVSYADLSVAVRDASSAVVWGQPVAYSIEVSNAGPATATNATVDDAFPAQLANVAWTCTASGGGACTTASGTGNISARKVTLPSGAKATFAVTATVVAGSGNGTLANTATVTAPSGVTDPDPTNNADADVNGIGTLRTLTVEKAAGRTGQGSVVSYPEGIACAEGCATTSMNVLQGGQVTLTAVARPGDTFAGWSGACAGAQTTCTLSIAGDATALAAFDGPSVTTSVPGGHGALSCLSPVAQGATAACTVTPDAGYVLAALADAGADVLAQVQGATYGAANVTGPREIVATFRLDRGQACGAGAECGTGLCVDGVCCNAACEGQCEACDVPGSAGTCAPVAGAPRGARAACASDGSACGGACDGTARNACTYPDAATACRGASCSAGTATLAAACDGAGACPAPQTLGCGEYACGATACLAACQVNADCAAGAWCSAGACVPKGGPGAACSADDACAGGHCADGVCCNAACNGQCEACDVPGSVGTCAPVAGAPHGARAACASDGSACGGACDGAVRGACAYPGAATACRGASCSAGTATLAAACDGAGACPAAQTVGCGGYACGESTCRGDCAVDGDCAAGNYCAAGVCQPRLGGGQACAGNAQCASGFCTDGVCCDGACNGQCEACNVAGHAGACTPVTGAPVGPRPACESDGTACGGACDGANGAACTFPRSACRAGACAAGVATVPATCDGAGHCPAAETVDCAPYACGASACKGDCGTDADCAAGGWCAAGVCTPKKQQAEACGAGGQCASGACVDGVCCDRACDGQCEACDVAGHAGACTPVTGAPHGGRTACEPGGAACGAACDGTHADACAYPQPIGTCRAGSTTAALSVSGSGCSSGGATGPLALLAALVLARAGRRRAAVAVRVRPAARVAAGLLALALPRPGAAQSIDVERFHPQGGAADVLAVPSAAVPGHLERHLSLWLSYADQPLRIASTADASVAGPLVASQTTAQLGASIGLLDRFELAATVPMTMPSGDRPSISGVTLPKAAASLGDVSLAAKAHLVDAGPLGLALGVPVRLPTGRRDAYAGQGEVTGGLEALAEWRGARGLRALASAGFVARGERQLVDLSVGRAVSYGVAAELPLAFRVGGGPLALLGSFAGEASLGGGARASPMELLFAARARLPLGLELTLGGGPGVGAGYGTPRFRVVASAAFVPRPAPAVAAAPPPAPRPAPRPALVVPLPPPPVIVQVQAPAPAPPAPPVVAAPAPPAPAPLPAPPPPQVVVTKERLVILEQVHFATARDAILPESFPLLEAVARALRDHPELERVRVEGHTDTQGKADANRALSDRRARRVRAFLVQAASPTRGSTRGATAPTGRSRPTGPRPAAPGTGGWSS